MLSKLYTIHTRVSVVTLFSVRILMRAPLGCLEAGSSSHLVNMSAMYGMGVQVVKSEEFVNCKTQPDSTPSQGDSI